MYNAQLFAAMAGKSSKCKGQGAEVQSAKCKSSNGEGRDGVDASREERELDPSLNFELSTLNYSSNLCLVPEWRVWRWPRIRSWTADDARETTNPTSQKLRRASPAPQLRGLRFAPKPRTPNQEPRTKNQAPPTTYVPVPYLPLLGRNLNARLYRATLDAELARLTSPGDILYASWLYPDGVAVAEYAARAGRRAWLMVLGSDTFHLRSPLRRRQIVRACDQAEGVVCVWQGLADRLVAAGVDETKIHVVPNGADTARFRYRTQADAWAAIRESLNTEVTEVAEPPSFRSFGGPRGESVRKSFPTPQYSNTPVLQYSHPLFSLLSLCSNPPPPPLLLWVGNLVSVKRPDLMLKVFGKVVQSAKCKGARGKGQGGKGQGESVQVSGFDTDVLEPDTRDMASQPRLRTSFLQHLIAALSRLHLIATLNRFRSAIRGLGTPPLPPSPLPVPPLPNTPILHHSNPSPLHHSILVMIGTGPLLPRLQRLAAELNISDRVHFIGSRPHAEVALWMNAADCLCLTSQAEGMPNVVIEALASGCPVVATDVGACRDLLEGQAGCGVVERVQSAKCKVQGASGKGQAERGKGQGEWGKGKGESERLASDQGPETRDHGPDFAKATSGKPRPAVAGSPLRSETKNHEPRTTNEERFAACLCEILAIPVDRSILASRNADRFSWDRMAEQILRLIQVAPARPRAAGGANGRAP